MAGTQSNNGTASSQKHTVYPYYGLSRGISVAEVVRDLGGANQDVRKSQIAHALKMPDDSPSLLAILGAARLYGLVDGRGTYRLTELAKSYFHPTSDGEKRIALLKMLKNPPLFSALIERFDGAKFPTNDILLNILHREHHIAKSWQTRAASMFMSSLREAQLIDGSGILRYSASMHSASGNAFPSPPTPQPSAPMEAEEIQPLPLPPPTAGPGMRHTVILSNSNVWSFKLKNETVRIETSFEFSLQLWEKLNQYVQLLKPEASE